MESSGPANEGAEWQSCPEWAAHFIRLGANGHANSGDGRDQSRAVLVHQLIDAAGNDENGGGGGELLGQ